MVRVIKNGALMQDDWTVTSTLDDVMEAKKFSSIIIPFETWSAFSYKISKHCQANNIRLGLWVNNDDDPHIYSKDLAVLDMIAVPFPNFMDGRGFSIARILRDELGFKKEIRAVGEVYLDQLMYLTRCGFSAFELQRDYDMTEIKQAMMQINTYYQGASDGALPIYGKTSI